MPIPCTEPKPFRRPYGFLVILAACVLSTGVSGCAQGRESSGHLLRVWSHQGQEAENQAMRAIAEAFNQAHADEGLRVQVNFFPDYQYTEKVSTAAAAGDLPDVLDLDGPTVAQFAEAGLIRPLGEYLSKEAVDDFLDTLIAQGTIDGTLYALGAFDSALALYFDQTLLEQAGVTPPVKDTAWTWEEFLAACRKLKASGVDPVAMHMDASADEWFTYAFSPLIWSAGGRLISEDGTRVDGVLNSPVNVRVLVAWQRLFAEDLAATDPVDPDPFGSSKTAMDWNGHWMAHSHLEKKGARLGVMPLPRMGEEPAAACGSWCWAISSQAGAPEQAARWIQWVTDTDTGIVPVVRANGAIPARTSAFAAFPEFEEDPYRLFRVLLETAGHPRPRTPHYATLTQHFARALRDLAHGTDARQRLDRAAEEIQRVIDR